MALCSCEPLPAYALPPLLCIIRVRQWVALQWPERQRAKPAKKNVQDRRNEKNVWEKPVLRSLTFFVLELVENAIFLPNHILTYKYFILHTRYLILDTSTPCPATVLLCSATLPTFLEHRR